jgi:hypothetical protein
MHRQFLAAIWPLFSKIYYPHKTKKNVKKAANFSRYENLKTKKNGNNAVFFNI